MNIRRIAALLLALTAMGVFFTTAEAKHRVRKAAVSLEFYAWAPDKSVETSFGNAIAGFEKANKNIKVNFNPISSDLEQTTEQGMLGGSSFAPPDVLEVDAGWVSDFGQGGYLQREDTYAMAPHSTFGRKTFLGAARHAFNYHSEQYAYPTGYTTLALWYNKDMLKAAGYKKAPSTWKSFTSAACKTTNSSSQVLGASLSLDAYHWFPFLGGFGAHVLNGAQTAAVIDSKQGASALGWYTGSIAKGCAESTPVGSSNIAEFAAGHVAMTIEPSTSLPDLRALAPSFRWGIAALPKGPKGESDIVAAMGFAINAQSAIKSADWKFVAYLNSPKVMRSIDTATGYLPGRTTVAAGKGFGPFQKGVGKAQTWAWPPGLQVNAFPHVDSDIQGTGSGAMTAQSAVTGLLGAPRGIGATLGTWASGRLMERFGTGPTAVIGTVVLFVFTLPYIALGGHTSFVYLSGVQVLQGFGVGISIMPAMTAAYRAMRPDQIHDATPQLNTLQRIGSSIGTAILIAVLAHGLNAAGSSDSAQAHAFGVSFAIVAGLTAVAMIAAVVLTRLERRLALDPSHAAPVTVGPAEAGFEAPG